MDRRTWMGEMRNGPKIDLKQRGEVRAGPRHHGWPGHPFDVSSVERRIGILAAINFWQSGVRGCAPMDAARKLVGKDETLPNVRPATAAKI